MSISPSILCKRGFKNYSDEDEVSTSLTIPQPDQSQIQTAISEALNPSEHLVKQCRLDEASMEHGMLVTAQKGGGFHNRVAIADQHTSLPVEPRISNSCIKAGRDMNVTSTTYLVTGNIVQVFNKYEGTTAEIANTSESGRKYDGNTDNVAAGMLIPSLPPCILERESQHNKIVANLASVGNAKVAILGMGGIGKTTLACSVARDTYIVKTYPRRLFLSFEGCSTPDLAYTNLAAAFHIPADRRSSHNQVISQVLNYLEEVKTLLIIDNFETYWEVSSNRRAAEELLGQLGALSNLAMIITLRGIQRPGNLRWVKIEPLQTLTGNASKELLCVITNEGYVEDDSSEYVQKLLDGVAGIPLAVTLIGGLLRDNWETPKSLWNRWTRESTQAIGIANDDGPDDRLYKLDVSLRISIFGPRMSNNTREVLAAIAILPKGLNVDETWLDKFQDTLPSTINIRSCISALQNAALCILEPTTSPSRLRLLPPIRDFCLKYMPLSGVLVRRLIDIYNSNLLTYWDPGLGENYTWVMDELSNISAILALAITYRYVQNDFVPAVCAYTEWRRFLCIPETDTVEHAMEVLSEHPQGKGKCLRVLSTTLLVINRVKEALQLLGQALSIHRKLEDKREVGQDLYFLSRAYYRMGDYANAEHYLTEARDLVTEIGDSRVEGGILEALADVYFEQDRIPEAENVAKEALKLGRVSGDRKGQVNALRTLGRIYHKQGRYDIAIEKLTASRDTSQATHDTSGDACATESLGYLYRDARKLDQAALHFRSAISLYERAQRSRAADNVRVALKKLEASSYAPNEP